MRSRSTTTAASGEGRPTLSPARGGRSPGVAAVLSLIFPGLGQLYAGRASRAFVFALPAVVVVVGATIVLSAGVASVVGLLVQPTVLAALVVGLGGLFLYHVAAIVDAHRLAARRSAAERRSGAARAARLAPLAIVVIVALAVYGVPAYVGVRAAPNLARLFPPDGDGTGSIAAPSWESSPSAPSGTPPTDAPSDAGTPSASAPPADQPTSVPTAKPFAGPEWARDGRLNVVLLGADEGPGRWSLRTDAVFLLSVDVATARTALFGFPRYMSNIPLPPASAAHWPDGRYPKFLNALYVAGLDYPRRFPDNDERGLGIVAAAVQEIAGVRVDHYAMVNLNGFVEVVDAMGGLWIDVPEPGVFDDRYAHESGERRMRLRIKPGCQLLDGTLALAFSRSRHQDSDYARMGRQTETIAALRRQFDPIAVLPRVPELFDIAGDNVYWTLSPSDVGPMAELAARVDADEMERVLFIPPEYDRELPAQTIERIRAKVRGIFDAPPRVEPSPSPTSPTDCPPAD